MPTRPGRAEEALIIPALVMKLSYMNRQVLINRSRAWGVNLIGEVIATSGWRKIIWLTNLFPLFLGKILPPTSSRTRPHPLRLTAPGPGL